MILYREHITVVLLLRCLLRRMHVGNVAATPLTYGLMKASEKCSMNVGSSLCAGPAEGISLERHKLACWVLFLRFLPAAPIQRMAVQNSFVTQQDAHR